MGLGHDRGEHGGRRTALAMVVDEALDGLGGQERHVTRQDENGAFGALGLGLQDGVTAAQPLALNDRPGLTWGQLHDTVGVRSNDQHDAIGERLRGAERIGDQGTAAERVEHFRLPRAHPLAFARSENDGGQSVHRVPYILHREAGSGYLNASRFCRVTEHPSRQKFAAGDSPAVAQMRQ